jgi:ATP-dependent RNA helicase DHX57
MPTRTTNACESAKKSRPAPCAPSVQKYVHKSLSLFSQPSSSPSLPHRLDTNNPPAQTQNYISATTIRDVSILRNDLLSALASAGLVQAGQPASAPELNAHAREPALLKALLLAALYPRVARVSLPRHAVKFARVAGGAVERDAGAHEWRATDMRGARVWVHPASVQFAETRWRSGIVVSFERVETSTKVFLRDVTEVQ